VKGVKPSVRKQCKLISLNRSNLYYSKKTRQDEGELTQEIMEIYEKYPIYGYRRITAMLHKKGVIVNRKRVQRLMKLCGLKAIYPGPNTSKRNHAEMVQPYLLKDLNIERMHQVWQIDITYLRVSGGFVYLTALIDVYSRLVVSWCLSNDLCTLSCIDCLDEAVAKYGISEIVNSDQGAQFTSEDWLSLLVKYDIKVSMTGVGRSNDNAYVERLWRTLKYEGIYLHGYKTIKELKKELPNLIWWYNNERPHQSIGYKTPREMADEYGDKLIENLPTIFTATTTTDFR
jgi:putative transposase